MNSGFVWLIFKNQMQKYIIIVLNAMSMKALLLLNYDYRFPNIFVCAKESSER